MCFKLISTNPSRQTSLVYADASMGSEISMLLEPTRGDCDKLVQAKFRYNVKQDRISRPHMCWQSRATGCPSDDRQERWDAVGRSSGTIRPLAHNFCNREWSPHVVDIPLCHVCWKVDDIPPCDEALLWRDTTRCLNSVFNRGQRLQNHIISYRTSII